MSIWKKNTYLNISYNNTSFSSNEFPTQDGMYEDKYDSKYGLGLQYGKTFLFHKKPIGDVLFIGLDYTGIDLNYNVFEKSDPAPQYFRGERTPYNLPWHNKKLSLDYAMMAGPSLTIYPFTALGYDATDRIRIQLYYHLGYNVGMTFVKDVEEKKGELGTDHELGHGFLTSFGFNVTWDFVGIGYESRRASRNRVQSVDDDYKSSSIDTKQTTNRIYLQFRF